MGAALAEGDALDGRAADGTGLAGALVDAEVVLKIAAAIDPIDGGAIAANAFFQNTAYSLKESGGLLRGKPVRQRQGVQAGQVKGFVGVDVSQAGEESLVEQQRFELAMVGVQADVEGFGRQGFVERFGAQLTQHHLRVAHQPQAAKFARVIEGEGLLVGEMEQEAVMRKKG